MRRMAVLNNGSDSETMCWLIIGNLRCYVELQLRPTEPGFDKCFLAYSLGWWADTSAIQLIQSRNGVNFQENIKTCSASYITTLSSQCIVSLPEMIEFSVQMLWLLMPLRNFVFPLVTAFSSNAFVRSLG